MVTTIILMGRAIDSTAVPVQYGLLQRIDLNYNGLRSSSFLTVGRESSLVDSDVLVLSRPEV